MRAKTLLRWILLGLWMIPLSTLAQNPTVVPSPGQLPGCDFVTGIFGFSCIPIYVAYLIKLVFGFAGGMTLYEIIMSGYQIAMGGLKGGDTSGPRGRLLWALCGLAVCVFSFLIVDTIIFALAR